MSSISLDIHGVKAILIERFDYSGADYSGATGVYLHLKNAEGNVTQITCYNAEEIPVLTINPQPGETTWDVRYAAFKKLGC